MSSADPLTQPPQPARYDLLAVNLTLAAISALLMAAVGSTVKVVQLLEKIEIFGVFEVNVAVGAAVNPGVLVASVTIFFALSAAICCTAQNRLRNYGAASRMLSFLSWTSTCFALVFFIATLILIPLSLAVEVGL